MSKKKDQPKSHLSTSLGPQDLSLKQFQIKQKTRLCVCLIFIIQWILKFSAFFLDPVSTPQSRKTTLLCLPFSGMMAIIIAGEYFMFKKKPLKIAKYSKIVDGILLLLFMGDWMSVLLSILINTQSTDPPTFKLSVMLTISGFSWRTLFVTLLVQKWYCKMIAPIVATLTVAIYTVCLVTEGAVFMFLRTAAQIFNIIVILYCDDKVKWRLMKTNLEQDKWNQVNNFILDSIPENIMILDLKGKGNVKFMSEYCKSFLKRYSFLDDIGKVFKTVQDLKQQLFDSDHHHSSNRSMMSALQIERVTTCHGLCTESNETYQKIDTLEDLVKNFSNIIEEKNLQERQFLIYNGKLKIIEEEEEIKSIEVKISFVRHFEDDCMILIFRDTTQRDLLVALEQTNKYKDQLLASVSHELRAPLNGNINWVEGALNSPRIPDDIKENLLTPALRSSRFLLHMINDILDMSQIKEKKLRLTFQSGDLKETLKSTAQLVELQAQKKGIKLAVKLDPRLPKDFCTDHIRLSQIVLNLLTNALKFTKEGVVKLTAAPVKGSSSWFKISVKDSGVGIGAENIPKLFSSYTHIEFDGRQMMNPMGIGLGLNIAYNLAELLGPLKQQGIKVTSTLNEGSTFSFIIEDKETILLKPHEILEISGNSSCEIPSEEFAVALQPIRMLAKEPLETTQPRCACSKILVVDDNPFNTMALETILTSVGLKCDSVYRGSNCIKKLVNRQSEVCCQECKPYSIVFMDQEMPEMSGIETVNEIKRLQKENLIPDMKIIGCTAHKSKDEMDKFMASGLDQCISKPISMGVIKDILSETLFKE